MPTLTPRDRTQSPNTFLEHTPSSAHTHHYSVTKDKSYSCMGLVHMHTMHNRGPGLGCRVLQNLPLATLLAQASPHTKAQAVTPRRKEVVPGASHSQSSSRAGQRLPSSVTLPACSGLTPPPCHHQRPSPEGAYCWGLEVGWGKKQEL